MKAVLVLGAGGFIGGHLINHLRSEGCWVRGADIKAHEFLPDAADEFLIGDLRDPDFVQRAFDRSFDEVYQFAADMGGAGYIFSGQNDAEIVHNSGLINLNVANAARHSEAQRLFFSSSACVYPKQNQLDPKSPNCSEDSAYPANPDSEYGWEKLFSERLFQTYGRQFGLCCRIARYHNIFGPFGTWKGGKEKAPAAICRKVAEAEDGSEIEIWGDGLQTRSFLHIDECIEGTIRLMRSPFENPVNIGSDKIISINDLAEMAIEISGKSLRLKHIDGLEGVRGRNSDNRLIANAIGWSPSARLRIGLEQTYAWISEQTEKQHHS
jgi:GDP-D-mannose 3', 5'-epimerase